MLVFKIFFKIVKKNIVVVLIYMVLFITLALFITQSIGDKEIVSFSSKRVDTGVIDRDNTEISKAIVQYMKNTQNLKNIEDDVDAIQDALFFRDIEYLLVIPEGFSESFMSDGDVALDTTKVPNSYSGIYIDMQLEQFIAAFKSYMVSGKTADEALAAANEVMAYSIEPEVLANSDALIKSQPYAYYYRYLAYLFIAIMINIMGTNLVIFNKEDISKRMLCSAMTLKKKNTQLILASAVVAVAVWVIMILLSFLFNGNSIVQSEMFPYLAVNSLALMIVSVAVGYFVGSISRNDNQITIIGTTASLALSFLSGVFVETSVMNQTVLKFSQILPTYWYVRVNDMIGTVSRVSGANYELFIKGIGVQLLFSAALMAVTLVISKRRSLRGL